MFVISKQRSSAEDIFVPPLVPLVKNSSSETSFATVVWDIKTISTLLYFALMKWYKRKKKDLAINFLVWFIDPDTSIIKNITALAKAIPEGFAMTFDNSGGGTISNIGSTQGAQIAATQEDNLDSNKENVEPKRVIIIDI